MEVFATFDIINDKGEKVAEGHKASFCLEDNLCKEGVEPSYACANYGDQGETGANGKFAEINNS
jgi:lysyl oxidase-like protein 2/3/4